MSRTSPAIARWLRAVLHVPVYLYRARLGFVFGHRFLLLVHRGRRSGRRYETVVEVVSYGDETDESVVLAGWGARTQWLRNVEAGGALAVETAGRRFKPLVRRLEIDEAAAVLAEYERRNRLIAPIVRRVLSRLVGWRYDGSAASRRRLVIQLPMLAFRPDRSTG
ncbi:MAG TPA: nitroreductase family deazaflavin-dependent oxidoreductase [Candidatus Limnocylindria bacterium]|nr:nitroreductase family deazaflavin-dependent oxidoreductase [Candidatus Limnocylindria bacterium]